jgi:adenosylhomocysteinase
MSAPDNDGLALAWRQMPVLAALRRRLRAGDEVRGRRIAIAMHLSKETAYLARTLRDGGADVVVHPSSPATIDERAAAYLTGRRVKVTGGGEVIPDDVRAWEPELLIDNGVFTVAALDQPAWAKQVLGATLHSSNAIATVREAAADRPIEFPAVSVAETPLKSLLETPFGAGQSAVVAIVRATGVQLSGKVVAVVGFGAVGTGVAEYLRGMRARVVVVERSPLTALRAHVNGYQVDSLANALSAADVVITCTGGRAIVGPQHFGLMRDGVILANVGHHPEIDVDGLAAMADARAEAAEHVEEFRIGTRSLFLLGGGRQVNHVCGEGNSSELMDLSLAVHVHCLLAFTNPGSLLPCGLQPIDDAVLQAVAAEKLRTLGHVLL